MKAINTFTAALFCFFVLTANTFVKANASDILVHNSIGFVTTHDDANPDRDPYIVSLVVDMTDAVVPDSWISFDPAIHSVYVSGSFAGWPMPGTDISLELQPLNRLSPGSHLLRTMNTGGGQDLSKDDLLYSINLQVPEGEIHYKFFLVEDAPTWNLGEWHGDPNRVLFVDEDTEIFNVWGECCPVEIFFIEPAAGSVYDLAENNEIPVSIDYQGNQYIGLVLFLEGVNTGIEYWIDYFDLDHAQIINYTYFAPLYLPGGEYIFKVGYYDGNWNIINSEQFTIINETPFIEIMHPLENNYIYIHDYNYIVWRSNNIDLVNISYSLDDGQTWEIIESNYPSTNSNNQINWQLPAGIDDTYRMCRIKVEDISDSMTAISELFTISNLPLLQFNSPTAEDSYVIGTDTHINIEFFFNGTGEHYFPLYLSNYSSYFYMTDFYSNEPQMFYYDYAIPDGLLTGDYHILTLYPSESSSESFHIENPNAFIKFNLPVENDVFDVCDEVIEIEIESFGVGDNWGQLHVFKHGWWQWFADYYSSGDGVQTYYYFPELSMQTDSYQFRMVSPPGIVYSDHFIIENNNAPVFQSPEGGESFVVGVDETINVDIGLGGCVDLQICAELFIEYGGQWQMLENFCVDQNTPYSYVFNIPLTIISGDYRFLAYYYDNVTHNWRTVYSEYFQITNENISLAFVTPAGGESFTVGVDEHIDVAIEMGGFDYLSGYLYVVYPFGYWEFVEHLIFSGDGLQTASFSLTENAATGSYYFSMDYDGSIDEQYVSGAIASQYFNIINDTETIQVSQPGFAGCFTAGNANDIRWNTTNVNAVNISYSPDDGDNWYLIANNVPSSDGYFGFGFNYYTWYIPNSQQLSDDYRIKIENTGNPSHFEISEPFSMRAQPAIVYDSPAENMTYLVGYDLQIDLSLTYYGCGQFYGDLFIENSSGEQLHLHAFDYWNSLSHDEPFDYVFEIPLDIQNDEYRFVAISEFGDKLFYSNPFNIFHTYVITATAGENGTIEPEGAVTVIFNHSQGFSINADEGYHISDVYVDDESIGAVIDYVFYGVASDHTIHSVFDINTYEIVAVANDDAYGAVTGAGQYDHFETVVLTAIPNTGYHFVDWTEGETTVATDPVYEFMAAENRTLVANFVINTYDIVAVANDDAYGAVTGAGQYDHFEMVELSAIPQTGYHFVNWTEDGVEVYDEPVYSFMVDSDRHLLANFMLTTYSLSFNVVDAHSGNLINDAVISIDGTHYSPGMYVFENIVPAAYEYSVTHDEYFEVTGSVEILDTDVTVNVEMAIDDTNADYLETFTIKVYPNPSRGTINIESDVLIRELQVIDLLGQTLYRADVNSKRHIVNLYGARGGLYFIRVYTSGGVKTLSIQIDQ